MENQISNGRKNRSDLIVFYVILCVLILWSVLELINVLVICWDKSPIVINNTGFSYTFQLLLGYAEVGFASLPHNRIIEDTRLFAGTVILGHFITFSVPLLYMAFYARKIMNTLLTEYTPFLEKMPDYIYKIGTVMVMVGLLSKPLNQILISTVNFHTLYFNNPFQLQWILGGLMILLLEKVFKVGVVLQKSYDETL